MIPDMENTNDVVNLIILNDSKRRTHTWSCSRQDEQKTT